MFSGIVEFLGEIRKIQSSQDCLHFTIAHHGNFNDVKIGDSIAVNGVCLTCTAFDAASFNVTVAPETLRLTNLGELSAGESVNLERSLKLSDRIGGHYVQGHVDGIGEIIAINQDGEACLTVKIRIPEVLAKLCITKGYITLDGMSITLIEVEADWISVMFIPHTQAITRTQFYKVGSKINIEVDVLGKYVAKLMETRINV